MKKLLFLLFSISTLVGQISYSAPESVEWDEINNRWLIGNNGNGKVYARTLGGTLTEFCTGMSAGPHGIEILGDVLYCCDGGYIRGYNLSTGGNVFNLNLSASFLNGLTTDGDSILYATDFSAKKIFKINVFTSAFSTIVSGLVKSPNGILYEGAANRLVFVNWGSSAPIMAVDLATNATSTLLSTSLGNCDGITKDSYGNYYVTAWSNNKLNKFVPALTGTSTIVPGTLSSPADIDCKFCTVDTVGIPNSSSNSCSFIGLWTGPAITQAGNILSTDTTYTTYQWYKDNVLIPSATMRNYTITEGGSYHCVVTKNGCTTQTNAIVSTLGTESNLTNEIKFFPNPVGDELTIEFYANKTIEYSVVNMLGEVVLQKSEIVEFSSLNYVFIQTSNLMKGSYIIHCNIDGNSSVKKFTKE